MICTAQQHRHKHWHKRELKSLMSCDIVSEFIYFSVFLSILWYLLHQNDYWTEYWSSLRLESCFVKSLHYYSSPLDVTFNLSVCLSHGFSCVMVCSSSLKNTFVIPFTSLKCLKISTKVMPQKHRIINNWETLSNQKYCLKFDKISILLRNWIIFVLNITWIQIHLKIEF